MAIKTYEEMNELGLDILKEIGTIGGGNAADRKSACRERVSSPV